MSETSRKDTNPITDPRNLPAQATFFLARAGIQKVEGSSKPEGCSRLAMEIFGCLCTTTTPLLRESISLCLRATDTASWQDIATCTEMLLGVYSSMLIDFLKAICEEIKPPQNRYGSAGVLLGIIRRFSLAPHHQFTGMSGEKRRWRTREEAVEAVLHELLYSIVMQTQRVEVPLNNAVYQSELDRATKEFVRGNTVTETRPLSSYPRPVHYPHSRARKRMVTRLMRRAASSHDLERGLQNNSLGELFLSKLAYARFGELTSEAMISLLAPLHPLKNDGSTPFGA